MKKITLILSILLFNSIIYAQTTLFPTKENKTISIYDIKNGLPSILPSKVIKLNDNGNYDIYKTTNGLPSILPTQTIKPIGNNSFNLYDNKNGLPGILPTKTFIIK